MKGFALDRLSSRYTNGSPGCCARLFVYHGRALALRSAGCSSTLAAILGSYRLAASAGAGGFASQAEGPPLRLNGGESVKLREFPSTAKCNLTILCEEGRIPPENQIASL
jgi:hypothetical protein